jgi:hypothetical protein
MMQIVPLTVRRANDFVEQWHRHSARTANDGGKFAVGLEHEGELVGVAIVGRPVARLLQSGQQYPAELLRLCVSPECPKGGPGKLYARARRIWQLMGGTHFHTYTLTRETGAVMRGVGFNDSDAVPVPGGKQWTRPSRPRPRDPLTAEPKLRWSEELPGVPV